VQGCTCVLKRVAHDTKSAHTARGPLLCVTYNWQHASLRGKGNMQMHTCAHIPNLTAVASVPLLQSLAQHLEGEVERKALQSGDQDADLEASQQEACRLHVRVLPCIQLLLSFQIFKASQMK
jgi:hypothetical protein